jgi:raffinose/stachyose/melibiose transport system substrate-binding protein
MKKKLFIVAILIAAIVGSVFAGASPDTTTSGGASGKFQSRPIKILSIWDDTDPNTNGYILTQLSNEYAKTVEGFEWEYEYVSINDINQRVAVYQANNDLPDITIFESGARLIPVIQSGQIVDLDKALAELGIADCVDAGAASLLRSLNGIGLYDLPLGMNMEGFWFNKALFTQAGLDPNNPPKTWDEFMAACEKLKAAGITPIVEGGSDRWPMTRVLNAYLVRSVGLNAVQDVAEGKAKFTDPAYVAAAQMFRDMATKGYFATGMNTIDPSTASAMLMNGQAAIKYDGSWFSSNLNSADNAAGPDGIGFFNVPLVTGVTAGGTLDDYSMNCGNIMMFATNKYDAALQDWMKYVLPRIGDFAMETSGSFKGFKVNSMPSNLPSYTKLVGDVLGSAEGSFLWFEAKMPVKASEFAQNNIAMLYNGEMTPIQYMTGLQEAMTAQ